MKSLVSLQKKALRLVYNSRYNAHTSKMFALSGVTPVEEKFKKESLMFIKKMQLGKQPKAFDDWIEFGTDSRLRSNSANKIKLTKFKKGNVFYSIINEWNNCEPEFRDSQTINQLKAKMRDQLISNLNSRKCTVKKCFSCQRDKNVDYHSYMLQ